MLKNIRYWSLVRNIAGWQVRVDTRGDHINRQVNLSDLLLSVVKDWHPVNIMSSGEDLSQIELGSANVIVGSNNIVIKAINEEELFTLDREVEGIFPSALLTLALGNSGLLWASANLADAVRIHLSDNIVIFVELTHLWLNNQGSGESSEHWVALSQDNCWSWNRWSLVADLSWSLSGRSRLASLSLLRHWARSVVLGRWADLGSSSCWLSGGVTRGVSWIQTLGGRCGISCISDWSSRNSGSLRESITN